MNSDYKDIIIDIRKIVRSINLESKRILREFGISIPQLLCLGYLKTRENYLSTHKELTEYLNLNSSTVTGIINRLEKKGYIARLPKQGDKRVTYLALTSTGATVLEKTPDLLHEKLSRGLAKLSVDEVDELKSSLNLLIEALDIRGLDASPLLVIEEPISPQD
ncbi:MAG TPA: MarR family transcriptional regulator [Cyclobacteriaceae bacterium]|nr:MarR family transcriptional regulator [Cyclobacteriaceae bacterium]